MPCDRKVLADVEALRASQGRGPASVRRGRRLPAARRRRYSKEGEPGESLFVVRSGEIELFIKDTAGQKIVLAIVRSGEVFGELALLDPGARTATAVALVDSELLELDREDLLLLFKKTPAAALQLLASMGHMTRKADELLRTRVSRNANVEAGRAVGRPTAHCGLDRSFSGSMPFLMINAVWFIVWIAFNILPLGSGIRSLSASAC
jgi:CRP-like cAMP-binding protein